MPFDSRRVNKWNSWSHGEFSDNSLCQLRDNYAREPREFSDEALIARHDKWECRRLVYRH